MKRYGYAHGYSTEFSVLPDGEWVRFSDVEAEAENEERAFHASDQDTALRNERDALKAEVERLVSWSEDSDMNEGAWRALARERDTLSAENARLRAALKEAVENFDTKHVHEFKAPPLNWVCECGQVFTTTAEPLPSSPAQTSSAVKGNSKSPFEQLNPDQPQTKAILMKSMIESIERNYN
jgi:hypothetical protein